MCENEGNFFFDADIPNFLKTDEHKERFWDSYMKTINRLK